MFGAMKPISRKSVVLVLVALAVASGCVPTEGEGGRASIRGHVQLERRATLYNPSSVVDQTPAMDHNVFLVYGDNVGPDDRVETNHEGDFLFPWLRPGSYTVYVFSADTAQPDNPTIDLLDVAFVREVESTSNKEEVVLDTLVVYDKL